MWWKEVSVEAFLINEISSIKNERIERVTNDYPYLQNLVFSDCSSHEDYLEMDLLIVLRIIMKTRAHVDIELHGRSHVTF